jgi:hypothetical protein
MLKSYQRRAFLLCLLTAVESTGVAPARAGQTPGAGLNGRAVGASPALPAPTVATVMPSSPMPASDTSLAVSGGLKPETETLWDALSRIDRNANAAAAAAAALPVRLPLGAVPGFTVPASPNAKAATALLQKKRRRSIFGPIGDWFDQWERSTGTSIKASGSANMSFRNDSISGGATAIQSFQEDNYLGRGANGVYNDVNMHVDATLFNSFHYSTDINNNLYTRPDSNRMKMEYKTKSTDILMGDINAGFQGNSLIDFNRYLSGVEMTNHWTKSFQTSILAARTKADTQTRVIPGNNSSGPYFVFSGQIVQGSVHVRVDNGDKVEGKDYTLDPISGQLNFLNGVIVAQTSTIAVSYETLDVGQGSGGVYGFRSELLPNNDTKVGMTYVIQQSPGSAAATAYTQQFFGNPLPFATNNLDYPIDPTKVGLTKVTVNNIPQILGTDYTINNTNYDQFYMTRALNTTDVIQITYYPLNANPTPGNRSVFGLDGRVGFGRLGSMTLETAFSGLSITGKGVDGQAWQAKFNLTPAKNLRTDIILKNVGPSYSSIQTPGFNQNEKSIQLSSEYSPLKNVHLNASWEKAKRPSYATSATGVSSQFVVRTAGNDTYNQYTLGASWGFAKNASLNLSRNSFGTEYIVGGQSTSLNDTLAVNYTWGKVGLDAGLTRSNSFSSSINSTAGLTGVVPSTTAANAATTSDSFSKHMGLTWNPAHWFHMTGSFSDTTINNYGAGVTTTETGTGLLAHSDARESQLATTFDVSRNLKIEYGLSLSDTGNLDNSSTTTSTTPGSSSSSSSSSSTGTSSTGTSSTGTTSSGTGTTSSGTSTIRSIFNAFFAPWHLPYRTRDTTVGSVTSSGSVFGGGVNSGLGSTGNYGGILGNGYGTTYSGASIGGRSIDNRINIAYSPTSKIHTLLGLDSSSSIGDYLYNSNRTNTTLGIDYTLSKRLHFNVNYNVQKVAYTGGLGNTSSNTLTFDFEGRPFGGKLNMRVGWQSVRNNNLLNQSALTSGTTGTTTSTTSSSTGTGLLNTSTDLGSYLFHVDYPLSNRISIFLDLSDSITSGYDANSQTDTRFGLDFPLTQALKFSLGWQLTSHTTPGATSTASDSSSLNYRSSSLLAEFGLRF